MCQYNLLDKARRETEKKLIREILAKLKGNMSKAAKVLGVSRMGLYILCNRLDIKSKEYRENAKQ
jgi:DNA-binding NtrC family response regulator